MSNVVSDLSVTQADSEAYVADGRLPEKAQLFTVNLRDASYIPISRSFPTNQQLSIVIPEDVPQRTAPC
jgi:hypothetical protein